jgi:hypothetical protein
MAYDDLKRIAGVRVGASPLLLGKAKPSPATSPQVIPSPQSALKFAFGRAGARDLRTAILSPTRAAPIAAVASSVLAGSTAGSAMAGASSAPAPAPMPASVAIAHAPINLQTLAAAAGAIERAEVPPPPAPHVDEPPPLLANLPAKAIQAIEDHHDDAPPKPPLLPSGPIADVLRKAVDQKVAETSRVIPGAAGGSSTFSPVSRATSSQVARGASLFSGPASRGYSDVSRAQSAPRTTNDKTTKGRSIMASRYKGTGEITYCPINSDGVINSGTSATLPGVRAQKPFQAQELLIDPTTAPSFDITDIKIGNEPVGVTAGSVSAQNFPPSNGPKFSWKVADGVDIIFSVANTGTLSVAFTAMLVGEVVEPV